MRYLQGTVTLSHPRSGLTWLRYTFRKLGYKLEVNHAGVGLVRTNARTLRIGIKRWAGRRVLFLARDPRDMLLSNWHAIGDAVDCETLEDFLFSERWGVKPFLKWVNFWWKNRAWLDDLRIFHYEDMKDDYNKVFHEILDYVEVSVDDRKIAAAIEAASFDRMKQAERLGPLFQDLGGGVVAVRRGEVGAYRDEMKKGTIDRLNAALKDLPPMLERYQS